MRLIRPTYLGSLLLLSACSNQCLVVELHEKTYLYENQGEKYMVPIAPDSNWHVLYEYGYAPSYVTMQFDHKPNDPANAFILFKISSAKLTVEESKALDGKNRLKYPKQHEDDPRLKYFQYDRTVCSRLGGWFGVYYQAFDRKSSAAQCGPNGSTGFCMIAFQYSKTKEMIVEGYGCMNSEEDLHEFQQEFYRFLASLEWLSADDPQHSNAPDSIQR